MSQSFTDGGFVLILMTYQGGIYDEIPIIGWEILFLGSFIDLSKLL